MTELGDDFSPFGPIFNGDEEDRWEQRLMRARSEGGELWRALRLAVLAVRLCDDDISEEDVECFLDRKADLERAKRENENGDPRRLRILYPEIAEHIKPWPQPKGTLPKWLQPKTRVERRIVYAARVATKMRISLKRSMYKKADEYVAWLYDVEVKAIEAERHNAPRRQKVRNIPPSLYFKV